MKRLLAALAISCFSLGAAAALAGHYLLVWAGDLAKQGHDFLTVIDADPSSTTFGRLVSSVETAQVTVRPHHTKYTMPASGMLFANDHDAGSSFIFDVRDPRRPTLAATFNAMAGVAHPHSYMRLPNGPCARDVSARSSDHAAEHDGHVRRTRGDRRSGQGHPLGE